MIKAFARWVLKEEIEAVAADLADAKALLLNEEAQLSGAMATISELEVQLQVATTEHAGMESVVTSLQDNNAEQEEALERLRAANIALDAALKDKTELCNDYKQAASADAVERANLTQANELLRDAAKTTAERLAAVEDDMLGYKAGAEEEAKRADALQARVKELEIELAHAQQPKVSGEVKPARKPRTRKKKTTAA